MAIVITNIPNEVFRFYSDNNINIIEEAVLKGILLPDDATNGDIIQNICSMWIEYYGANVEVTISKEDWNAPYRRVRTTKAGDTE